MAKRQENSSEDTAAPSRRTVTRSMKHTRAHPASG
ncbi:hypothetical protein EVA_21079 [gut metagenome]|uniref:Uncharacterized protein n=1 Tax=gut metagenome TaxID=749906 RepID=J9F8P0_9ZZZZ